MINLRKTLIDATTVLTAHNIKHALIGGFALASYGYHRATSDIDLLADGQKKDLIKSLLQKANFNLIHESSEVLQFKGNGFLDVLLANRPLSQEMLNAATMNTDLNVYVLKAEDIIGLKIQAYKNDSSRLLQDQADIQNLLKIDNLNFDLIKKYADLFNEWPTIQKIKDLNKNDI